jgi:hypothetical protein
MMCPNINSYKRLLGGEAMWAPDTASYGYESRAASVRLIGPPLASPSAARFEIRIPGADMNTHYAIAAIFALGLRGIEKKMPVTSKPYGQPGSTYAELVKLPTSLEAAVARFTREGSVAREVFGDFFVDHFGGTREHEIEVHRRAVTSWEGEWRESRGGEGELMFSRAVFRVGLGVCYQRTDPIGARSNCWTGAAWGDVKRNASSPNSPPTTSTWLGLAHISVSHSNSSLQPACLS